MKYPNDFCKNSELNLWLPSQDGFNFTYSDGLEEEIYLENCLRQVSDLSSSSTELASCIRDWSSEYHLSPQRSSLLRPLKIHQCSSVLELGAGCGAITRYLGENIPHVIALEGSKQRAKLAALRCKDLNSVQVVVSNFKDIEFNQKFDAVTLIGVIEYSGLYLHSQNPYQKTLEIAKHYLKDDGILILAIENKLGLKYWARCSEDHTGLLFDGIEGYVKEKKIQTFGKRELENLLKLAGFDSFKFLYPFPDYKLPEVLLNIDEAYLQRDKPWLYQWLGYCNSRDYRHSKLENFHEFLVAKQLEHNGLWSEMSNSFLVLASSSSNKIDSYLDLNCIAYKYSVKRYKQFMTQVSLCQGMDGSLKVVRKPIYPSLAAVPEKANSDNELKHYPNETTDFVQGKPLMEQLVISLRSNEEDFKDTLQKWYIFLVRESKRLNLKKTDLPGIYIDCTPWNLILTEDDTIVYIDREWDYLNKVPVNFVVFRGLIYFYINIFPWIEDALSPLLKEKNLKYFVKYCFKLINLNIEDGDYLYFNELEFNLQRQTSYLSAKTFDEYFKNINSVPHVVLTRKKLDNLEIAVQKSQTESEYFRSEWERLQSQLHQTELSLEQTELSLEQSRATVIAMESSKFWKMRTFWFRLRRTLGVSDNVNLSINRLGKNIKHVFYILKNKGLRYAIARISKKIYLRLDNGSSSYEVLPDNYQRWLQQNFPRESDLRKMAETVEIFPYQPVISVIMPTFNTSEHFLREAIESVINQVYPYWELCIADDASTQPHVKNIVEEYAAKETRIKVIIRTTNGHISNASNSALEMATGEFIALLDHDDLLTPDALYEVALLLNRHPEADMIYSDEDKIDETNKVSSPYFKPDWCPDSFLSRMYTCHLGIYRRELVKKIGGFRVGYEGSQDYDLVLRLTEKTENIFHIPKILYHWRIHPQSAASGVEAKPYAYIAGEKALMDALQRRGENGIISGLPGFPGLYRVRYKIEDYKRVSIIIPTRDLGNILNNCLKSIFEKTVYPNYEVIVIDNGSTENDTVQIIDYWKSKEHERFSCYPLNIEFNFSKINNYAVAKAKGDYLLFLNNDIEVITEDWIDAFVEQAQRPSIGAVGGLLLYPDKSIQHAGVVLGIGGVASHGHKKSPSTSPGYAGQLLTINNYSAITGACLMCRSEVYKAVGGFAEELAIAYNDVDFCLKLLGRGYRNIYLPHVVLYHHESKSRGSDDTPKKLVRLTREAEYMKKKWGKILENDPCYNPNLTKSADDYSINL